MAESKKISSGIINGTRYTVLLNSVNVGGDRNWRNNNPGNIIAGPFAFGHGAIGSDGRFAIFPNIDAGYKALSDLLHSDRYINQSIENAIYIYAPNSENDTEGYIEKLCESAGVDRTILLSALTEKKFKAVISAIYHIEGGHIGHTYLLDDLEGAPEYIKKKGAVGLRKEFRLAELKITPHVLLNLKNFKFSKSDLNYLDSFIKKYHLHCILSGARYEGWVSDIKAMNLDYLKLEKRFKLENLKGEMTLTAVSTGTFDLSTTNIKKDAADGIKDADSSAQKAAVDAVTPQARAATAGAYQNASESAQEALLGRPGAAASAKAAAIYAAGVGLIQAASTFASGGLVTKPTLSLIAEAGQSEAVIPLSNLRSDPMRQTPAMEIGTYSAHFPGVKSLSTASAQSKSSVVRQYLTQQQKANRRTGNRNGPVA